MAAASPRPHTAASSAEPIVVGVRLRPFVRHEKGEKQCLRIEDSTVHIITSSIPTGSALTKSSDKGGFAFDYAMDSTDPSSPSHVSQAKCYELMAQRMVGHACGGFSSCLICYGQTGTGKTMTIMGNMAPVAEQGVLLRLLHELFKGIESQRSEGFDVGFHVQMLEVYNEKIKDLLVKCPCPPTWVCTCTSRVDVHLHPKLGVYVKGAVEQSVESLARCMEVIEYGNNSKTVAATAMNARSSRGHTVFKLRMERRGGSGSTLMDSEIFFVDLAGRENEKTTQVTGDRMVELTFINKSLMFLASCIQSLGSSAADVKRKTEPSGLIRKDMSKFRNSKLTLLLSNALTGNSKTSLIGTLSPAAAHFEESLSTLRFASTVKNIKVEAKAKIGIDNKSLVSGLQEEIKSLKEQIALNAESRRSSAEEPMSVNVDELQRQLESAQAMCSDYQKKWEEEHDKRRRATSQMVIARMSLAVGHAKFERHALSQEEPGCKELNIGLHHDGDSLESDDSKTAELHELRRQLQSTTALCEELQSKLRKNTVELVAMRFRLAASHAKVARLQAPSMNVDRVQHMATSVTDTARRSSCFLNGLLPLPSPSAAAADSSAAPQPAEEKFPEPIRGFLWKKSPNLLRAARPWDRRYVTLVCGRFSWWIPEEYAGEKLSDSREGDAKGFVELPCNKCNLVDVEGTSTQFGLHVEGIAGNFTGGGSRTFLFDCAGSESSRADWIAAIKEHMACKPGSTTDWIVDILRSGVLKLISAKWLIQQASKTPKASREQLPAAAVLEPAEAARLYRESGCLAVLT